MSLRILPGRSGDHFTTFVEPAPVDGVPYGLHDAALGSQDLFSIRHSIASWLEPRLCHCGHGTSQLAASAPRLAFTCFVDLQPTALDLGAIQGADGGTSRNPGFHLHKPEPAGSARVAIDNHPGR
jgi:hypothetical protein